MLTIRIKDEDLQRAAAEGLDAFVNCVSEAVKGAAGGKLDSSALTALNADQVTLWGYMILREEVMDGGFIQLIHNGYGPFFFRNPFAAAVRAWGLDDLAALVNKGHRLYNKYRQELERECSDEEFMALFEQFPKFDDLDDRFVENEEAYTARVAAYIDEHLADFCEVEGC